MPQHSVWRYVKQGSLTVYFHPFKRSCELSKSGLNSLLIIPLGTQKTLSLDSYLSFLSSPHLFFLFLLQTATSSWPMHKCRRAFLSSTALMASVSSQASPGPRSCRRAVPVSSCMGQRPAKASSSALTMLWRSERSLKMRSCSTKRQVGREKPVLLWFWGVSELTVQLLSSLLPSFIILLLFCTHT